MTLGLLPRRHLSVGLGACSAQVPVAIDAMGSEAGAAVVPATTRPLRTSPPRRATPTTTSPPTVVAPTSPRWSPQATDATTVTPTSTVARYEHHIGFDVDYALPAPESFGDGTHIVGADIQAGRYEALEPGDDCSWQRLSGLSGEYRDVLADGNPQHRTIIDVLVDDAAVVTSGCGPWTGFQPFDEPLTEFGPGTWAIGEQILPGTYSAPGGAGCFWATVTGFDGSQTSISAIARPETGPVVVTLTTDSEGNRVRQLREVLANRMIGGPSDHFENVLKVTEGQPMDPHN